jgi:hypothetical protein
VFMDAGRATLEPANSAQKALIDRVEVGHPAAPKIRLAFEVHDAAGTTRALVEAGAGSSPDPSERRGVPRTRGSTGRPACRSRSSRSSSRATRRGFGESDRPHG